MENTAIRPPAPLLWVLKFLLLFLSLNALVAGALLIADPSGQSIRFPEGALAHSPFSNYRRPGILLFLFNGVLPLYALYALWRRPVCLLCRWLNPFPALHWAWTLALTCGIVLIVWILVQMTMVPYFFLQPVLLGYGILIVLLCMMPEVRARYRL